MKESFLEHLSSNRKDEYKSLLKQIEFEYQDECSKDYRDYKKFELKENLIQYDFLKDIIPKSYYCFNYSTNEYCEFYKNGICKLLKTEIEDSIKECDINII